MVVAEGLAAKCAPYILCMLVLSLAHTLTSQLTVEVAHRRQLCLLKSVPGAHVFVGVDTLSHQQVSVVWLIGASDLESLPWAGTNQPIQGGQQELGRVNES